MKEVKGGESIGSVKRGITEVSTSKKGVGGEVVNARIEKVKGGIKGEMGGKGEEAVEDRCGE